MQIEFVVILVFLAILAFGFWFWRSRTTPKIVNEPTEPKLTITAIERLEQFRKDLFKAYASI